MKTFRNIMMLMAGLLACSASGAGVDLGLSSLSFGPTLIQAGTHPTAISFSVYSYYSSTTMSSMPYKVDVYLSRNGTHSDSDDIYCGSITGTWTQSPGTSLTFGFTSTGLSYITIPSGTPSGTYYVFIHMTPNGGGYWETDDSDNWDYESWISVNGTGGHVDLGLSSLSFSPTSIPAGTHPTGISFNIYSYYSSVTMSSMPDKVDVYLSRNGTHGDSDDIYCGSITGTWTQSPGTSHTLTFTSTGLSYIAIPNSTLSGTYYVFVHMTPNGGGYAETADYDNWTYKSGITVVGNTTPVVLLLHGMNSSPSTWEDFYEGDYDYFNTSYPTVPVIYAGVFLGTSTATMDKRGVRYYSVQFGAYDATSAGRAGVEGIRSFSSTTSGDFTSFFGTYSHAKEVKDAIAKILSIYPKAKILLVGHSRGGIDGRAFLETSTYIERSAVVGLLTTGTPHQGSAFGRVYSYLANNPRDPANSTRVNDWGLVDQLRINNIIDVRRPTITDLTPGSTGLTQLANSAGNLPTGVKYATVRYTGVPFGILYNGIAGKLDVFRGTTGWIAPISKITRKLSLTSSNYICQYYPISNYAGDGLVPLGSQRFTATGITIGDFLHSGTVTHIDEPGQTSHIRTAMKTLVNWWN